MKWIKLSSNMFDDDKIQLLEMEKDADKLQNLWVKLICLAGKQDRDGVFTVNGIPCDEKALAALTNRPLALIKRGLDLFIRYGLIVRENGFLRIAKWSKHQTTNEQKERDRARKSQNNSAEIPNDFRENSEQFPNDFRNNSEKFPNGFRENSDLQNKNIDIKEKLTLTGELKEKRDTPAFPTTPKRTIFVPPTVDEVAAYCREKRLNVDAGRFVDFYESKGWMVGKNKMKDWHAAVRGWASREVKPKKGTSYDIDEIEAVIMGA